ncbi:hypothetical protein GCM10027040_10000 [Halomonas shantousis]
MSDSLTAPMVRLDPGLASPNAAQMLSSTLQVIRAGRLLGKRWPLSMTTQRAVHVRTGAACLAGQCRAGTRLMSDLLCFGYLLVFAITVLAGWFNDVSGDVALAFLPTLAVSVVAMLGTRRLLAS